MNILFLGGDKRYVFLIEALSKEYFVSHIGFDISGDNIYKENLESLDLSNFDYIFLPINGINDNMQIKTENRISFFTS